MGVTRLASNWLLLVESHTLLVETPLGAALFFNAARPRLVTLSDLRGKVWVG